MGDSQFIPKVVELASNAATLQEIRREAAAALLKYDGEHFPSNSCAIFQSKLWESAGLKIEDTYLALAFVELLEKRGWTKIAVVDVRSGKVKLQTGDVGTTCYGAVRHPNVDHVYAVIKPMSEDENLIADNQEPEVHFRYIDGTGGKSPTTLFLRAPT